MDASESPPFEAVPDAPAPWDLHAAAYILALRLPVERLETGAFVPDALRGARFGRLSYAMFVDYDRSPVGPYHELLFIPGRFRHGPRTGFTITRIFVSSAASVVNGRRNWGIPKQLARFEVDYGADRVDRVRMFTGEQAAVELSFRHYPLGLPLRSQLVPAGMRTLCQTLEGRRYSVVPSARGALRAARLLSARIDAEVFPPFAPSDVVAAVRLPDVQMTFPAADVEPA